LSKESTDFKRMVERDGYVCLFCPKPFTDTHPAEIEHLDNNHDNNRIWNKTFSHHDCNNKKKLNGDFQIIAGEKILSNKKYVYVCERTTDQDVSSSEQRNKTNRPVALQWIQEKLMVEPYVLLRDSVNAIVNLTQSMNGTGSKQAVYQYLNEFTNPYNGLLEITEDERGQKIIKKRTEN